MRQIATRVFITIGLGLFLSTSVMAIDLELTQGINSAQPIGIDSLGGNVQAQSLEQVLSHDLSMTGQFKLIHPPAHAEGQKLPLSIWQRLNADSVVQGSVTLSGYNRYAVHIDLLDAASHGRVLLSRDYQASSQELRRLGHHISDDIVRQLTGERGIFSTRIAYVLVKRDAYRTRYSLEVAEVDGSNPQSLIVSSDPIMSPAWSPDGRQIAYVSFERKRAQIYTVSVETGQRRLLTDFPGINGAPAWSPDGSQLAVVLSKGGNPKIYLVALSTGTMKQVTWGDAIDTEPRFSPDGRSLLFTSGRGGSPQVYKLNLASGEIARMTYAGNYNAKASFTPNQQQIVMLHREDRAFNIGVMRVGQSSIEALTDSPMDESPALAPNGRLVMYATREHDRGLLALVSTDGRVHFKLPAREGDIQEPAWSPYLG